MTSASLFVGAASAPARYIPWSYDKDCQSMFAAAGNPFGTWPSGCGGTTFVDMPPWEPGVVFQLAALRLFGMQPSLVVLAGIQVGLDVAVLFTICWLALEFGGPLGALAAGSIYSESIPLATASTFPFYYYWPIPIIVALAAVLLRLSQNRSARAALAWGTLAGALAAGGCWFRGTMVTVALLTPFVVFVLSRATGRPARAALFAVAAIILVLLPSAWHNLPRTGSVTS